MKNQNMTLTETWNADFIDAQYRLWKAEPDSVSRDWRFFFQGFELAGSAGPAVQAECTGDAGVNGLIHRYRDIGHLLACLDPLEACPVDHPLLNPEAFELSADDLEREFYAYPFFEPGRAKLRDIIQALRETYCRSVGVEFMHLQDPGERQWLLDRMEPTRNRTVFDDGTRKRILVGLFRSALFEAFLNKKYVGVTRFSLEGADALIPAMEYLADRAARLGCREIILGMAHRGRLNVLAHVLGKPYEEIFREFENCYNPDELTGAGDVKYHNGYLGEIRSSDDLIMRIFLMNNPSHLESVDPVVEGFARGRQDIPGGDRSNRVLPLLIHGDAAFAGQGIVAETLNMSQLEGYKTGGTIHIIINNQIGFTTLPEDARSTRYATDTAKMLMVPIFHVHGEDPEAVLHAVATATEYRWKFGKDVVLDLICYRRYGHNEGDEPYFTQPKMYERIRKRPSLHRIYADGLVEEDVVGKEEIDGIAALIDRQLNSAYDVTHGSECAFPETRFYEDQEGFHGNFTHDPLNTGVERKTLLRLARKINTVPEGFALNPKIASLLKKRLDSIERGEGIDWANAETLAFAALLTEGYPIRLSGQDSGRGTFSQRHSVLIDPHTGSRIVPLNSLAEDQPPFVVYDSLLSEAGVLGFEYGYSLARPGGLTLWEAQFGDFVNNAQAIIDLYLASGESKWRCLSGLVLLLPHGSEGLGPEHSSARPERFLQLCAGENMQVCNPSTPAQYFHLLRRQAKQSYRKPLVVLTPKSLLRHPLAVSAIEELTDGYFKTVLYNSDADDPDAPGAAETILFCSGKISYELLRRRSGLKNNIAVIRLEQLYPFPENELNRVVKRYGKRKSFVWVQEEPENMGGWRFVKPRLEKITGKRLSYIGREEASSPATGFPSIYKIEQEDIIEAAVGAKAD